MIKANITDLTISLFKTFIKSPRKVYWEKYLPQIIKTVTYKIQNNYE